MSQTGPTGGQGQAIPTPSKALEQKYHWWFRPDQTGVYNSSPPARYPTYPNSPSGDIGNRYYSTSATSSPGTSYGSPPQHMGNSFVQAGSSPPDPKVAIPMPAPGQEMKFREYLRRNSLKNMYLLDDFGTPVD